MHRQRDEEQLEAGALDGARELPSGARRVATTARRLAIGCAWVGALLFVLGGVWALAAPHSFFQVIAPYPPYSRHLFHDVGAFQLGIAAALGAGLAGRAGLAVGLWGGAVGASAHAVSHWIDADLGGHATDPVSITAVAAVLVAGLTAAELSRR